LIQGVESKHLVMEYKGDGESYLRWEWSIGVGWELAVRVAELSEGASSSYVICVLPWCFIPCLIQCYGVPIYRIQYGVKGLHVDDKDWMIKWNLGLIISADSLELLMLRA